MAIKKETRKRTARRRLPSKTEIAFRYIQFSKKITVYILAYWGLYRLAQLVAGIIRPQLASSLVKLSSGIDTVAITFGLAYTGNSVAEKWLNVHKEVQQAMYSSTDDEMQDAEKDTEKEDINNG